jgi:uncharacterized protein (TIGR03118 family)
MGIRTGWKRWAAVAAALAGMSGLVAMVTAPPVVAQAATGMYRQVNLVSDIPGVARVTDSNLVNPWGMSEFPGGPLWVSDNATGTTTFYVGDQGGGPVSQAGMVEIPGGAPTGQVYNGTSDFVISAGGKSGAAVFIFASENGVITGWNPNVPPADQARIGVSVPNAVYKGLAIAQTALGNFLLAANFHSGQVDVFDGKFRLVTHAGMFSDPNLPAGYAPFNVAVIDDSLYVSYAKQDPARHDDVPGPGHGFIDVYSLDGTMRHRLVSRGVLNAPWGMVMAPHRFGALGGDLLVANFGDGTINAFDPNTGAFVGGLMNRDNHPVVIDGLWGLIFGNASIANTDTLIFSAGIGNEAHGLLGTLAPA